MLRSPVSGVGYVLGTFPCDWDRDDGRALLEAHCLVARSPSVLNYETVVGLRTEIYDPAGFSMDCVYLHMAKWTDTDEDFENRASKRDRA